MQSPGRDSNPRLAAYKAAAITARQPGLKVPISGDHKSVNVLSDLSLSKQAFISGFALFLIA